MKVLVKGAGDLATGVAYRLHQAGFTVIMTDIAEPTAVRRTVAFSQAIYDGSAVVEEVKAQHVHNLKEAQAVIAAGALPVIVDAEANIKEKFQPDVVVDAIIAKKNLNTKKSDAPIVIALGPGFYAGVDCHAVIETQRGHFLGKVLYSGEAIPNTGIPGEIAGHSWDRLVLTPKAGLFHAVAHIGDIVKKGDILAWVDGEAVKAPLSGCLRGLLPDGISVTVSMKAGDVDPRGVREYCLSISDKARNISGGVLEAILHLSRLWERDKEF